MADASVPPVDMEDKNRERFDSLAPTYNSRFEKTMLEIIEIIKSNLSWISDNWIDSESEDEGPGSSVKDKPKKTIKLLDYACGTGLITRALASSITSSIGIDISAVMVGEYNKAAFNQGIPTTEMVAYCGNLISPKSALPVQGAGGGGGGNVVVEVPFSGPEFWNFDIAAVGMGWHHFDDPGLAVERLVQRLKVGGTLLIVDFAPYEPDPHGHDHSHGHGHGHAHGHNHAHGQAESKKDDSEYQDARDTITHHGFAEEDTRRMFEEAGAGKGFEYLVLGDGVVFHNMKKDGDKMKRTLFMARGTKI